MKFWPLLVVFLFFCQPVFGMMNINDRMIGSAQEYGKSNKGLEAAQFLKPWTVEESLKLNPYAARESIIIYTPYLIVAMDAQNRAKAYEEAKPEEIQALAKSYDGILVIGAIIDAPEKYSPDKLQVTLSQEKLAEEPYYSELVASSSVEKVVRKKVAQSPAQTPKGKKDDKNLPAAAGEDVINVKMPVWNLQYYFYFDLDNLNVSLPFVLRVEDKQGTVREFRFHLVNMD